MDDTDNQDEPPFYVDRAKGGRANCKGCKQKCLDANLRLAKLVPSPYSDGKKMKSWYHVDCLMTAFLKQRPTTKRIDGPEDIGNWENITEDDRELILDKLKELEELCIKKYGNKPAPKKNTPVKKDTAVKVLKNTIASQPVTQSPEKKEKAKVNINHKDNSFREFRRLCAEVTNNDAYTAKTAVINKLFTEGTDGKGFKSDVTLWCRLLLPGAVKRVYNLKSKQLVKLFSRIFGADHDDMLTDLENGDVAETIRIFHEKSSVCVPASKSLLNLNDVDTFLEKLATLTKEEEQIYHFKTILKQCTSNDLKMIIRLVKGDLRINSGPKHILEAVHPDAYTIFQSSRDIDAVISRVMKPRDEIDCSTSPVKNSIKANLVLMTPVLPMLAEACKSVEMAMKKCPNGMYSEIKYDGERVQLHKEGTEFKYFSRALKPVMPHKINRFKDYIPKAFPHGTDLILDAEVLMIDTKTGKPLPFGSLGVHKKSEFKDAEVCLFVFDCIYYNGEILIDKPVRVRRKILEDNMIEIKNHVMFSEMELIRKPSDLAAMIAKVLKLGLEGLVLKDLESKYEPGKRHWLKVKKDYLFGGAMADSADLVVLGAWFGSGKKGGMLSVFLMGCYDEDRDKWLTVTKVHTGHDDKSLEELQEPLREGMIKISRDSNRIPHWLHCTNTMVPDFVAKDPKKQPVWEITGTEITQAQIHTADGISVRFPRVTRIRDDKTWDTATNLQELKLLYKNSKEHTDVSLLNKLAAESDAAKNNDIEESSSKTKVKKPLGEDVKNVKKIDEMFKKQIKFKEEVGKIKLENVKSENVKLENVKSESVKLEKVKSDNVKQEKVKKESVNIDSIKKEREEDSKSFKNEKPSKLKRRISDDDDECPPKKIPSTSFVKREPFSDKEDDSEDVGDSNKKYTIMYSPSKPLPNIFNGRILKLYIDDSKNINDDILKDYLRHWIAYGGKLDESADGQAATHVVHFTKEIDVKVLKCNKVCFSKSARHVTVNWLKTCIQSKRFECTRMYSVRLRSYKSHG